MAKASRVSPIIFVASALCFFLPFVTVSCGGQRVTSFSGLQLATGTTVQQPQMFGTPRQQRVDPDPTTALAAMCTLGAVLFSLAGVRIVPGVLGGFGAVLLLITKARLDNQVQSKGGGLLQIQYEFGFVMAVLLLLTGTAWSIYRSSRHTAVSYGLPSPPSVRPPCLDGRFCTHCGSQCPLGTKFCPQCGKSNETATAANV
jgi:hypothetical protein